MSNTVKITYSELSNAIGKLRRASGECEDYARALQRRETDSLSNYTSNDPHGNVNNANTMVLNKIKMLENKRDKLKNAAQKVAEFKESVNYHDRLVGNHAQRIMEKYIGKRSRLQQIGDFLYNTFCVDLINSNTITRFFGNIIKSGFDTIENLGSKVVDWFKHGGGKYVLNIVAAVVGAVAAVAAVVIAIITFPVTGTVAAIVLASVAIVAGVVSAVITIVNSYHQIKNNGKALDKYKKGDDGQARFYGDISSFSDETKKTDYGGKAENNKMEKRGRIVDDTKIVADVVNFVASMGSSLGAKEVINAQGQKVKGLDFSKKNVLYNLKKNMGWVQNTKSGKLEFSWPEMLKSSITKEEKNIETEIQKFKRITDSKKIQNTFKTIKKTDAIIKKIKSIDGATNKGKDAKGIYKQTKSVLDIVFDHKITYPFSNFIKSINYVYSVGDVYFY